ncbi:MAG: hypothetical protein AUJ92_12065 [Armatimonadetes bacterium CG2_30_59_28]|nr:M15 family metallopeptidase [Armatimonadota bacterium]OIO93630.1 MAG: hypothetical protein AUJ92_12065 [Armatimonadetes bacterium CG2_30_59_28]PIU66283.1 MAG: dipeptidase [Armatimonadetes bacterium CG07_land_8_20_14_0_80_59_28]PIY41047.1 MAG: dipeptidase [Armatimonadetes bacterium CG_4_10_14_3_um_filter_59_10]PJB71229.1 MAG: dipeptidase [Armatimonadetes bacterium CG_4_9_14_3_um_filter_58_7]
MSRAVAEPIAAVNRVTIKESNEALVDISEHCPGIDVPEPPQWVRQAVAEMLNRAQQLLPEGVRLSLRMGWRSLQTQTRIYEQVYRKFRGMHPEWPENILRRQTNRYVAPTNQKAPPGHTTGGAVDVFLIDSEGQELDTIAPFNDFRDGGYETFSTEVGVVARENRRLLYQAMTKAGFSNCAAEWWHFSYGDSAWAVRTGRKTCYYGYSEPGSPARLEIRFEEGAR